MPTQIDDSQIKSRKLESLIENVGHFKAPIENFTDLPAVAEDGERIYVKSSKKDFIYDASKQEWSPIGDSASSSSDEKIIVFSFQKPVLGAQKVEIKFPFQGYLSEISASLAVPGATNTIIQVQKCSQVNYENNEVWENVGEEMTVLQDKKTANYQFENSGNIVALNDYFRVDIKELGQNIEGLTLNIKIKLI